MSLYSTAKPALKRPGAGASKLAAPTSPDSTTNGGEVVDPKRQKKRELDRRCQRMARERTKARISYLEGVVEDFRREDGSGRVASLMKQLQDAVKERDQLAKTLKLIETSIKNHKLPMFGNVEAKEVSQGRQIPAFELLDTDPGIQCRDSAALNANGSPLLPMPEDEALGSSPDEEVMINIELESLPDPPTNDHANESLDNPPLYNDFSPYIGEDNDVIFPRPKNACDCCRAKSTPSSGTAMNMWRFANETLAKRETYVDEILEIEDSFGDDIPVRALIEGWDAVEARLGGTLPTMWRQLRKIDEIIFGTCAHTERLAIMRVMHLLLRYHAQPTAERKQALPAWYLKRPSQTLAHSYAIDFFVWPGICERFVFSQHRYCSNLFWQLFCRSFHLAWPFEFRDTYTYNTITREYKISASFEERIRDINAWTMTRDIFRKWPELYSDFPAWGHLPMYIDSPGTAGNLQHHARSSRALMPAQRGPVAAVPFASSRTATPLTQQQQHQDRHQPIARRGLAEEIGDEPAVEEQRRHSIANTPIEAPPNPVNLDSYANWWETPSQFSAGHNPQDVWMNDHKSVIYTTPMASAPEETLNAMSQMYDLPI